MFPLLVRMFICIRVADIIGCVKAQIMSNMDRKENELLNKAVMAVEPLCRTQQVNTIFEITVIFFQIHPQHSFHIVFSPRQNAPLISLNSIVLTYISVLSMFLQPALGHKEQMQVESEL